MAELENPSLLKMKIWKSKIGPIREGRSSAPGIQLIPGMSATGILLPFLHLCEAL
jgi:hypothetical protein